MLNQSITAGSRRSALVSCEELSESLEQANTVILDATFFLPRQQRNAGQEYRRQHIPGALFFDIDVIADSASALAHTLPSAEDFALAVGGLGIDNDTRVVVYDNNGFFAAARAWWMFRVFGHHDVAVLNGGLARWLQLSLPVTAQVPLAVPKQFVSRFRPALFCSLNQMRQMVQSRSHHILDARSPDSFAGTHPPAEPGQRVGHISGSINVPYARLRSAEDSMMAAPMQLEAILQSARISLDQPIVTTCGTGVSACVLALSLFELGLAQVPVYDGSWAEWSASPSF